MATTSFLYHSLGLVGYHHVRTEYRGGCIYHHVRAIRERRTCRYCGARWYDLVMDGGFERTFHALPVGARKQFVVLHGHQQSCKRCGRTLREPIRFADGKRRYLRSFGRFILELCARMTIKSVSQLLRVSWDLVKDAYKQRLHQRLRNRKLSQVRYLAVDEFSIRKGHRYLTLVLDLESGAILHAQPGREAEALACFLKVLRRRGARIQAVAMDMWRPYSQAVRQVFGEKVDIVHDPYHVISLANRAIDETRRDMVRQLEGPPRQVLKGNRFLLLKGLEHLSESALERLMLLMELNQPLYQAYLLKEDLRMFWNLPDRNSGEGFLKTWIREARSTGLKHFRKLADTLDNHREGLPAYFAHRISTGPLEGLNNKIKVLKRQAYGFRDIEYFKLRLYFLHEAIPTFPG